MSAEDEIRELLEREPYLSSKEIAEVVGRTQRHVRRTLSSMPDVACERRGRSVVYSRKFRVEGAGGSAASAELSSASFASAADALTTIDDASSVAADVSASSAASSSTAATTITTTSKKGTFCRPSGGGFSGNKGYVSSGNGANRGHFSNSGSGLGQDCPSFLNRGGKSHGNGTFPACSDCPFIFCSLERDAVGFVLVDEFFRNLLLSHARKNAWDVKVRGRNVYIRTFHLSFHLGCDSVVFYSDEPFDLEWICEWVRAEFAGEFDAESLESLLLRIRHPQRLSRDELTVVINDSILADAMVSVTELYFRPDGVLYFEPPNGTTPAFRMYRRGGTLRVEFDARNSSQSVSAFFMRNELLAMLPGVKDSPGLFFSFLSGYYDPGARTIVIDNSGVAEILRDALREILSEFFPAGFSPGEVCGGGTCGADAHAGDAGVKDSGDSKGSGNSSCGKQPLDNAYGKVDLVCRSLEELDCFVPENVAGILGEYFDISTDAGYFFLAAWSVWSGRRFKGRVTSEEVLGVLERQGIFVDCGNYAGELLKAGVFEERVGFDVCFSPVGIRLGKKIEGFWGG